MIGYRGKRKHPADNSQNGKSFPADNEAPLAKRAAEKGVRLSQKTVANGEISPSGKETPIETVELGEEEASEMRR